MGSLSSVGVVPSLWLATAFATAAIILPWLGWKLPLWAQLLGRSALFAALTAMVQVILVSPLQPHFDTARPGQLFWEQLVEASWWWVGARTTIALARLVVVLENRPRETRIVSDLLAGVITVASLLAIVNFAFEVPVRGLLATSGVIAIVLGLALQSTLSDVFSGVAVGLECPYKPGDNLWVEGGIEGRVVQVSWRSTQIATFDDNVAIVPNSLIAKSRLVNRSSPTPLRTSTASVALDSAALPETCFEALTAAALSCRKILDDPAPKVFLRDLKGEGSRWDIGFSVASSKDLLAARSELLTNVHRHLRHAGIALAVEGATVRTTASVPTIGQLLEQSDLFGVVASAEREALAPYFEVIRLHVGETLVRGGEEADALFLVASGTADVTVVEASRSRSVHRLSPGETLGAVSLITQAPYAATATALTEVRAFRLDRKGISAATNERPGMAAALEELARRGQDALRADAASEGLSEPPHPEMFMSRLKKFLNTLAA